MTHYTWEEIAAMLAESRKLIEKTQNYLDKERTIAAAFQRHIDERHGADFEVCADPECQKAVALERDMIYPD